MPHWNTRPNRAARGRETNHRGVVSMMVAARTSPPPRRTPTVLTESKARRARKTPMKVSIMVVIEPAVSDRWKKG